MTEEKIKCPKCGSELNFDIFKIKNNTKIFCPGCEELVNISLINEGNQPIESIENEVMGKIKDAIEKPFRGNKNIKIKWKK